MHLANKRGRAVAKVHRIRAPQSRHTVRDSGTLTSSLQPKPIQLQPLLLPASTKVSINADQTSKLIQLILYKSQLGIKIIGLIR